MTQSSPPVPRPSRRARWLLLVGLALLLILLALYATRKVIAREVLTGWLRSQGVTSRAQVQGIGPGGFLGRLQVGDPRAPDFAAGDATVTWGLSGLSFTVRTVTLRKPVLRMRLHNGVLSAGGLDPLIEALRKRPPTPDRGQPRIEIADGLLILSTDYGPVRLTANAVVEDGRLLLLTAATAPTTLHGASFEAALGSGSLRLKTVGQRVEIALAAPASRVLVGGLIAEGAQVSLSGQAPYPDTKARKLDGALTLRGELSADRLRQGEAKVDAAVLAATLVGRATGWIDTLQVAGRTTAEFQAATAQAAAGTVGEVRAAAFAEDLRWSRVGGDTLALTPRMTVLAQDGQTGDLRLPQVMVSVQGPLGLGPKGFAASLQASASGRGGWGGLGGPTRADAPQLAAIKRAAQAFQFAAPAITADIEPGGLSLSLPRPALLRPATGGTVTLTSRGDAPLFAPQGGAFRLAVAGGGLPALTADIRRFSLTDGGLDAQGSAKTMLSIGPLQDGGIDASGRLRVAEGGISFTADRCLPLTARRLAFGTNSVEQLSGQLCPDSGPMLVAGGGGWRLRSQVRGFAGAVPFLQLRAAGGEGSLTATQQGGAMTAAVTVARARVLDTATSPRFAPLAAAGTVGLARDQWTADFRIATPGGAPVATATLTHDMGDGDGGMAFDTGILRFAEGGLQPDQLSPLAGAVGSPAEGSIRFAGAFNWTPQGATSNGTLSVPRLDFLSPAGRVTGLTGTVAFTSLAPLIAAPGQTLRADSIAAIVPVTGVTAGVGLDAQALTITGGEALVGDGKVRIETLRIPFADDTAMAGVLDFEAVQLHDLIEASPFGDRVELDAKVSGRVPFESLAGKVRITGAELHAVQPGRLSINRQALSGVAASGTVEAPAGAKAAVQANDTFTDFAYQAMENLAFDKLEATIESRKDDRLGVLAHIVGRHDPPTRQQIKLSLFDLIGRKFMERPLPLPSNTGVDLTLDTTLNLDDLLSDYADYQRLRGSHAVQPRDRN